MDFVSVFSTLAALVADVPVVTQAIKKLIGRNLTWNDEPVELKEK